MVPTLFSVGYDLGTTSCPLDIVGDVYVMGSPVIPSKRYRVFVADTLYVGGITVRLSGYRLPLLSRIVNRVPGVDVFT